MRSDFYSRQNVVLKFIFAIILVSFAVLHRFSNLIIAFSVQFFSFLLTMQLLQKWFQVLMRLLPFFISLFIFGIIFQIPFENQAILTLRISFVLLISVYLITTTSLTAFQADTFSSAESSLQADLRFFLLAVFQFIPQFIEVYKDVHRCKNLSFSTLKEILQLCFQKIQQTEEAILQQPKVLSRRFDWLANSYLFFFIIFNILLLILG